MLEREGVDPQQLYEHVAKRLQTAPAALEGLHKRLGDRRDGNYFETPSITLATLHNWWSSRLPYYDARGIPAEWPRFMADLTERAAGGPQGAHWDADVSRQQEVLRPPPGSCDAK